MKEKVTYTADGNLNADIHILFTTDKRYLTYCGVCIFSIIDKNPALNITFHLFTDEYNDLFPASFFTRYPNVSVVVYLLNNAVFDGLQVYDFYPRSIYYRIVASNILHEQVSQLLYLDCDIVCDGNIAPLLAIDMADYTIAAVQDKGMNSDYLTYLGLSKEKKYFNSGVMLINTQAWVDHDVTAEFFVKIKDKKYTFPDQDCLNIILDNEVYFIEPEFNFIPKNKSTNKAPVFIHYAGQTKPWSVSIDESGYNKKYIDMYNRSPWKDVPLELPKKAFESYHYAKKLLMKKRLIQAAYWLTVSTFQFTAKKLRSKAAG
ncbi:glycosyltransferase [Erwinia billingiae]|uniref:glycosyltransferase family 8 protein n=1 Tax=Erwinia billingiae TaxID=182337 RepID=UPI00138A0F83|nr:glycosyltransferase [Erwinia billingiae]